MIQASINLITDPENNAETRLTVSGLTALQSAKTSGWAISFDMVSVSARNFLAKVKASLGGRMLKIQFDLLANSARVTSCMPASCARLRVASERPSRFVSIVQPAVANLAATADPIAPAATMPMHGGEDDMTVVQKKDVDYRKVR